MVHVPVSPPMNQNKGKKEIDFPLIFLEDEPHVSVVRSDMTTDRILKELFQGKKFIFDEVDQQHLVLWKKMKNRHEKTDFFLCFKNSHFLSLNLVALINGYCAACHCDFPKEDQAEVVEHPSTLSFQDRLTTASQEAFSNAFMWSNLELQSTKEIRCQEFYHTIENRLADPVYKDRVMSIYFRKLPDQLEFGIDVQGKPIVWPVDEETHKFRGTTLISQLADRVIFEPDKKGIRLIFLL